MSQSWHVVGTTMRLASGRLFDPCHPCPDDIDLRDMSHALSRLCRFGGHTRDFYSVAQHCVLVSNLCDDADARAGLLHDAGEAYIGDMVRPLKHSGEMGFYRDVEAQLEAVIAARWGLEALDPPSVKLADRIAVALEMRDLMTGSAMSQGLGPDLSIFPQINPLSIPAAEELFEDRAYKLGLMA